jgi:hypothetical protein
LESRRHEALAAEHLQLLIHWTAAMNEAAPFLLHDESTSSDGDAGDF